MAIYESIYILSPKTDEEKENKVVSDLKATYNKSKVKIISEMKWGTRPLPYIIKKEKEGVFYYFLWESSTGNVVQELENRVRVTDSIIRSFHVRIDEDIRPMKKRYLSGKETNINGVVRSDGAEREEIPITELIYLEPTGIFLRDEY